VAPLLFELSGGIVRIINNLVESALLSAAAADEKQLTAERLAQTAEQQFGISRLQPEEVDNLLDETLDTSDENETDAETIPTLTEFVTLPADNQPAVLAPETNTGSFAGYAVKESTQY
jgi:hypothetical protein